MCIICECEEKKDYSRLIGIERLKCYRCPNLTSIPNIKGLKQIDCFKCPNLTSIPNIKGLKQIDCSNCDNLTSIPNIKGLKGIGCHYCPMLTSIPNTPSICYSACPWIEHTQYPHCEDPYNENNIQKLLLLQKFCKKNFRYFVFNRWVKSQEFKEWFYAPENVGGRKHKKMMEREYA
jgi:hypothetical protein